MGIMIGIGGRISKGGGPSPTPTPSWTGHADAAGLREIGWDDEDIAYYQAHGVNWNAEDDSLHKVSDNDKYIYQRIVNEVLGGDPKKPIGASIPSALKNIFRDAQYCPWFNTSSVTGMSSMFASCRSLVSMPLFDTSKVTDMSSMFNYCYSLVSVPQFDTSKVTNMGYMFNECGALVSVPLFDTSKVTNMGSMFNYCYSLASVPWFNTSSATGMGGMFNYCYSLASVPLFDTSEVTNMSNMFGYCYSLASVPQFDTSKATNMSSMFNECHSLVSVNTPLKFFSSSIVSKIISGESMLNMVAKANNTSDFSQSLFLNYPAAKHVYEYSISSERESWMPTNDGSKSAQTWLAELAASTDKPHSSFAITLSFISGSSNYSG